MLGLKTGPTTLDLATLKILLMYMCIFKIMQTVSKHSCFPEILPTVIINSAIIVSVQMNTKARLQTDAFGDYFFFYDQFQNTLQGRGMSRKKTILYFPVNTKPYIHKVFQLLSQIYSPVTTLNVHWEIVKWQKSLWGSQLENSNIATYNLWPYPVSQIFTPFF